MEPIPQPVTNVSIYPYLPDQPIEVPPVFVNGRGTYSVGTLTTYIFYNLDLNSGSPQHGGVTAGTRYLARGQDAQGKPFQAPWMHCLQGGETPRFGRTIHMLGQADATTAEPDIAYRIYLGDVNVSLYVNPTEPLEVPLIEGGKGIATFAGLLPGGRWSAVVSGGKRVNQLSKGMRVTINGTNVNGGKPFHIPAVLVTEDAGDPATFLQIR
jgi:hypothetical protein